MLLFCLSFLDFFLSEACERVFFFCFVLFCFFVFGAAFLVFGAAFLVFGAAFSCGFSFSLSQIFLKLETLLCASVK